MADDTTLEEKIAALAAPLAGSLGLAVWGVECAGAQGRGLIRVFVERTGEADGNEAQEGGVGIEACASLSRLLGAALDVEDIVPGAYVLEISSPGLERTFFAPEQLAPYVGRLLDASLRAPAPGFEGRRHFRGVLKAPADPAGRIELELEDGGAVAFSWPDARRVRLVHVFRTTEKPGGRKKDAPASA